MPKIVDVEQRREVIADAVFALVERGGIENASLRNVAVEAGLSVGSVRHYVDGHEGMLIDAVRVMSERIEVRLRRVVAAAEGRAPAERSNGEVSFEDLQEVAVAMFEQLLPLDDERRREVAVWLAFSEQSRVQEGLRDEARALIRGSREVARPLLEFVAHGEVGQPAGDASVREAGAAAGAGLDLELRAEWLASAVDGLGIALLHDPGALSLDQVRALLRAHFASVVGPSASRTGPMTNGSRGGMEGE